MSDVEAFVRESNHIEGIEREPTRHEVQATEAFLARSQIDIDDLEGLVSIYQPGARLRSRPSMNVRVGNHVAPRGGAEIITTLQSILDRVKVNAAHPFILHQEYETLHPFMDGNGRSGRALWAWQMRTFGYRPGLQLGFLHAWYYQSLEHGR